jgi:hypothetical protein
VNNLKLAAKLVSGPASVFEARRTGPKSAEHDWSDERGTRCLRCGMHEDWPGASGNCLAKAMSLPRT